MEFNVKLQELRKNKGLTQEEFANKIFVSRTAVSKWESGRGYPNIESLKDISKFFSISIDELLSSEELLTLAEEDNKRKSIFLRDVIFGLLDISFIIMLFLPFFVERVNGTIIEVSLINLNQISLYVKIFYYIIILTTILFGLALITFRKCSAILWNKYKSITSIIISTISLLLFVVTLQVNASILAFVFLFIKVLIYIKTR